MTTAAVQLSVFPPCVGVATAVIKNIRVTIGEDDFGSDTCESYYGQYVASPPDGKYYIDRKDLGERFNESRECRYFVPINGKEYGMDDYKRAKAFNDGDFYFMHVMAQATIEITFANISIEKITHKIYSDGVSGIDSDCGDEYLDDIVGVALQDLKEVLQKVGFTPVEIQWWIDKTMAERKWRNLI